MRENMTTRKNESSSKCGKNFNGNGIALGAGIGVAIGAGIGVAFGNIAIGVGVGVALGAAIGMLITMSRR
jgi:hypothetical protein